MMNDKGKLDWWYHFWIRVVFGIFILFITPVMIIVSPFYLLGLSAEKFIGYVCKQNE